MHVRFAPNRVRQDYGSGTSLRPELIRPTRYLSVAAASHTQPFSSRMASCQIISMPASLSLRHGMAAKFFAAIALEHARVLDGDLFQRLQAVGGKAGRDHRKILDALLGERLDRFDGGWLEPFGAAEARLKGQSSGFVVELEVRAQQIGRRTHWI